MKRNAGQFEEPHRAVLPRFETLDEYWQADRNHDWLRSRPPGNDFPPARSAAEDLALSAEYAEAREEEEEDIEWEDDAMEDIPEAEPVRPHEDVPGADDSWLEQHLRWESDDLPRLQELDHRVNDIINAVPIGIRWNTERDRIDRIRAWQDSRKKSC